MDTETNCSGEISAVSATILGIFNGLSGFAAIVGNVLVLLTLYTNESFRLPSYYLLASLAVADLLVGVAVNPLYIVLTNFVTWQYREANLLQLESFVAMSSSMMIVHNLSVMSVERYIAVIHPLKYSHVVTSRRSVYLIAFIWIFDVMLNAFYFALDNDELPKLWIVGGLLAGLLPMFVVLFCYARILHAACMQSRRIVAENRVPPLTERSRDVDSAGIQNGTESTRNRKAAWTVAIVVSVAFILSTPVSVVSILQIITNDICLRRHYNRVWMWAATISLTSSALDPWIYAMRIREVKMALKRNLHVQLYHFWTTLSHGIAQVSGQKRETSID